MAPIITARAALMNNPMCQVTSDGKSLENVFGDIPAATFKAANLNLTFDDTEVHSGIMSDDGKYDGIIGRLQRNESDFSVFPVPLELMIGHGHDLPVKVYYFLDMTYYKILSHPRYNRTEAAVHSDLEESILVMSPIVVALYTLLFAFSLIMVTTVCRRVFAEKSAGFGHFYVKFIFQVKTAKVSEVSWNLVRFIFNQGSRAEYGLKTQIFFFFVFECAAGMLIIFWLNYMSADLVVYKKPILPETLEDVWRYRDKFNISSLKRSWSFPAQSAW